ncbi:hypothetical protein [Legionella waltersii]|uniref:Transmembrane protein n=1 Tax=Legionella waltersii TaxID=66969 RepID=A0A0W1AAP1_9GAMM|nr:hypothetical protein [Legionella waltersii]KTD78393.1 hypothetical protein Lwal_1828 [Legionella waltersii]SNV06276.1 Uncharacterised protein [Legionella waltersii]
MKSRVEKENENTNYYFLLKCLGALTAAAVITAGIVGAVMYKASAATAVGFAVGATASAPIAPFILGPMLLIALGAVCLLPFIFCTGSSSGYTYPRTTSVYTGAHYPPSYTPFPTFFPSERVVISGNVHGYPSSGRQHEHPPSTRVHTNPTGMGMDNSHNSHNSHTHVHN